MNRKEGEDETLKNTWHVMERQQKSPQTKIKIGRKKRSECIFKTKGNYDRTKGVIKQSDVLEKSK